MLAVTAIEYLTLGVEQYLRELPDDEYDALEARVRPPKSVIAISMQVKKLRLPLMWRNKTKKEGNHHVT